MKRYIRRSQVRETDDGLMYVPLNPGERIVQFEYGKITGRPYMALIDTGENLD